MGNQRFQHFKKGGAETGHSGPRHDNVGPIKTKNWPGLPGKTQPKTRNHGMRKVKPGAASQGIC